MSALLESSRKPGKRRVDLSVRSDYLDHAKKADINLSRMLEECLELRLRQLQERQWLEKNREAIAYHKARIVRDGMWNKDLVSF
jgi:antitoxin CcdA